MRIEKEDSYFDDDMLLCHDDAPFTGEVVARDANGQVIGLLNYVEGVEWGPHCQWYPDGSKKKEGTAQRGVAVGDWRKWHPNGQLAEHSVYNSQGWPVRRQQWDENGNVTEDRSYTA
ncbi:toxin-antitoxin system YwqK family antitoxin [Streptomyces tubercidicus]